MIFLDKAPLVYWLIAGSYKIFGVHDWAARIPVAVAAIALCLLTAAFGAWAFDKRAGLYAGLCIDRTCIGLFLFTRVLIPDVMVTFTVTLAMWALLRAVDEQEPHPRLWAFVLAASLGTGLLLKSLISVLFPVAAAVIYLGLTRQLFSARTWKRRHPYHRPGGRAADRSALAHILAAVRNPPFFAWTLHNGPGQYHGFLWYYFVNEQVLRFLNLRYPRDYSTVPRLYFWLLHLVWLFPWSVYFPALAKLSFKPVDRAGQVRLLALCWTGFVLIFFTFSTTQEYYSMPCYPAIALLLASAMAAGGDWVRRGTRALCVLSAIAAVAILAILVHVHGIPTPGDISSALSRNPKAYTLSLGHMEDLTLDSFAYLRLPLVIAGIAFLVGAVGTIRATGQRAFLAAALMMVLFFHAARLAMVVFDPYMGSRALARVLDQSPGGELIVDHHYYAFSSVFFYTDRSGLMLNGRWASLEYGSWAGVRPRYLSATQTSGKLWAQPQRYYLLTFDSALPHYNDLIGPAELYTVTRKQGQGTVDQSCADTDGA